MAVYLPKERDLFLYLVKSKVTSDCYVDVIEQWWLSSSEEERKRIKRLVINLDNGPEQSSRRTQFLYRLQRFSDDSKLEVELAYYPPYHSKYNPVERTFGALEQHWSGEILDSEETVAGFARSMVWDQRNPCVNIIDKIYTTGKTIAKSVMKTLREGFSCKEGIERWSVLIRPTAMNDG